MVRACFVRFVHDKGLTQKTSIRVETASGIIEPQLEADGQVTVNMGAPRFEPGDIPFLTSQRASTYPISIGSHKVEVSALSMGNPHAVLVVDDVESAPVAELGQGLQTHAAFPSRVNAGFMQVVDRSHIRLRVYERGSGETLACGTGACAAVVAGIVRGLLDSQVSVSTRGGGLTIRWDGEGCPVWMTGPAVSVFDGEMDI